jgi:hypothetical protein
MNHIPRHVGQPKVAAVEAIRQPRVVEAERVRNVRVQEVAVHAEP